MCNVHRFLFVFPDAPKIQGAVVAYTWERNAVNISCEVQAHPSDVSVVWLRDGLQLPNPNTTNIKIFTTPTASYLQVHAHISDIIQAYVNVYTHTYCTL